MMNPSSLSPGCVEGVDRRKRRGNCPAPLGFLEELPVPGRPSGHQHLGWDPPACERMAASTTLLLVIKPLGTGGVVLPAASCGLDPPMPLGQGAEPALPAAGPEPRGEATAGSAPKENRGQGGRGPGAWGTCWVPSERLTRSIQTEGPRSDGQGWGTQINQPNPGFTEAGMEAPRLLQSEENDRQHL